jgi:hypothetical protein
MLSPPSPACCGRGLAIVDLLPVTGVVVPQLAVHDGLSPLPSTALVTWPLACAFTTAV